MKRPLHSYLLVLLVSVLLWGCSKDEPVVIDNPASNYDASIPTSYFDLSLKITKETPGFSPPVAARAFGYSGLALYESVVHGMPGYRSLAGSINGLQPGTLSSPAPGQAYHWDLVANNALATFMTKIYANASNGNLQALENLRGQYNMKYIGDVTQETYDRSVNYGNTIANQIFAYAVSDGQEFAYMNNFPTSYVPPTGPGAWVPTPPSFSPALQPYWGQVRPFLSSNITATQPAPPVAYSTSPTSTFYAQALEVYTVSTTITPEQELIARYWSDDPQTTATPPGHSISVASQIIKKENASLAKAAEAFAKVGMSVHDAFISCWKCKFDMSLVRPITYIKDYIDPAYNCLLTTPPFPEYTSGHSVQSGAAAQVLSDMFGYNYHFIDNTHASRTDIDGSPRAFNSFFEMADEAAISRLYGGIHYRDAIERGVVQGKKVGLNISALPFKN